MVNKNKIAIIVVYFGKLPNYFDLWLKSCYYNPNIDFYVFTDQNAKNLPPNVFIVPMTLIKMKDRASKVLGFEAALSRPYKCCDYKPIYGLLFKDYLSSYDFWGHCDIDLIFGDLQCFFEQYNLSNFDKFGMLGHLALYKNNDQVNNAYKLSGGFMNYRDVYTNDKNCIFDEIGGISKIMKESGFNVLDKRIFADIATLYKRYRLIDVYPLDEKAINYPIQTFLWENGKTFHVYVKNGRIYKDEYIYVHFQKRPNYQLMPGILDCNSFFITNNGFIANYEKELTVEKIKEMNPYPGKLYEFLESNYNLTKRRIKEYSKRKFKI